MSSTTKTSVSPPSGCGTSSTQDTLQEGESTTETSAISSPPTLPDQGSDTSSPESESGNTPCASPGLQMGLMFGPEAVPVSRSPLRAPSDSTTTSDTCGQPGSPLFASADLQSFLENRLRARLAGHGSTLYFLTWKRRDIAARAPICALQASVPRTSDSGCFGWPTCTVGDLRESARKTATSTKMHDGTSLIDAVRQSAWPTPGANDWKTVTKHGQRRGQLNEATFTCAWKDRGELAAQGVMTLGATSTNNTSLSVHVHPLEKIRYQQTENDAARTSEQVQTARCGLVLTGSIATILPVPDGARLNPEHSRWLLGLPATWGGFAPTGTASSRR